MGAKSLTLVHSFQFPALIIHYVINRVAVEKLGSKTCFSSGGISSGSCFLAEVGFLSDCHPCLLSHVEEPHQSFQILCHGS